MNHIRQLKLGAEYSSMPLLDLFQIVDKTPLFDGSTAKNLKSNDKFEDKIQNGGPYKLSEVSPRNILWVKSVIGGFNRPVIRNEKRPNTVSLQKPVFENSANNSGILLPKLSARLDSTILSENTINQAQKKENEAI